MAPLTARRSHSMTDVDELKKLYRASIGHNFPTPFDISAAVGKREKKDIFKIHRPNRKCNADTILGFFKGKVKHTEFRLPTMQSNPSIPISDEWIGTEPTTEASGSQDRKVPRTRHRSKSENYPRRSKREAESWELRETKSLMLLSHLTSGLWPKDFKAKPMESDVVIKFPEKSILLLAQEDNDQVQMDLSSSSVASPNSQQNMRRYKGDSGVHIADNAVLTWKREDNSISEPTITCVSVPFNTQPHIRRVATKASLQSNYIPSLERLTEEPSLQQKVGEKQKDSSRVALAVELPSAWPRKDIGEVVVSHWERGEQQRADTEQFAQDACKSCSFENNGLSSSRSLLNQVTEEISDADFEEQSKLKYQKRRVTIATETPAMRELSPHYATKLEKQAFKKIREWKKGFAMQLDHVLQQRKLLPHHHPYNKINSVDKYKFTTDCPTAIPYCENVDTKTSSSPVKPRPASQALQQDKSSNQRQMINELRRLSEISAAGINDIRDSDRGSRILREIKQQRKFSKDNGENTKLIDNLTTRHRQEARGNIDDLCSHISDSTDGKRPLKQQFHNQNFGESKKLMSDLSSWHKQETGRVVNDLCSSPLESQEVTRLLSSLKETIDAIFLTTIKRISELVINSTPSNGGGDAVHHCDTLQQEALLRQLRKTKEERHGLSLQNVVLKKEITQLKSRLAELCRRVTKKKMESSCVRNEVVDLNNLDELIHFGNFFRIEEVERLFGHLREFAVYEPNLKDIERRVFISDEFEAQSESFEEFWIRQTLAETGVVHRNKMMDRG